MQNEHLKAGDKSLFVRASLGGALMGLANLVPGISGGTLLVAAGVYPDFVSAMTKITTGQFQKRAITVLLLIGIMAALVIVLLAGTVKDLVVEQRWVVYSLFIGLTLGGVPLVWVMAKTPSRWLWVGGVCGLLGLTLLTLSQWFGIGVNTEVTNGVFFFFLAGVLGAGAMVLPGLSGGYLWLLLGVYLPILQAIEEGKEQALSGQWEVLWSLSVDTFLPVALGIIVGAAAVSHLVHWALAKYAHFTLGVLLGLLLGALVGLWPFQAGLEPKVGDSLKGQTVMMVREGGLILLPSGKTLEPDDYPVRYFSPSLSQVGGSVALIMIGLGITLAISCAGQRRKRSDSSGPRKSSING